MVKSLLSNTQQPCLFMARAMNGHEFLILYGLAAEPGFEPGLPDPESGVLPLHHSATQGITECNTTLSRGQCGSRH